MTVILSIMDTLSDVNTRRDGTKSPSAGLTSSIPLKADITGDGVSVRFAQNPNKKWYVLRASYGRAQKAAETFDSKSVEYHYPQHHVVKLVDGKKRRILEPLLPNLIFVYTTEDTMKALMDDTQINKYLSYYYDHFKTDEYGKNPPLTIEYKKMMNFILVTSIDNEHTIVVGDRPCRYKSGDIVRVVDGDFKGVEGRVARVASEQRVVVEIEGLCVIATAYIPTAFISPVNKNAPTSEV